MRTCDGSAGDADYGAIGATYARFRQADLRIAAAIHAAIGDARRIINVGAGSGSYEPTDREVVAVEPSATMRAQRPPHLTAAIDATAENLPFLDKSFDAAMATVTIHQWSDLPRGLSELARVTRGPIVLLVADPARLQDFWLKHYAPEVLAQEAQRFPAIANVCALLGGDVRVQAVAIPLDCTDGFNEAYYGRPEMLLDPAARLACSSWSFVTPEVAARFEGALRADLETGAWDARWGALRTQDSYDGSLRLVIGNAT
jgi:SAM-dependent methyltransferase